MQYVLLIFNDSAFALNQSDDMLISVGMSLIHHVILAHFHFKLYHL